jgi:hypothetical protein
MSRRTVRTTPRMEAQTKGESTYTGKACSECGNDRRFVSNGNCSKSYLHEDRRQYFKEYRRSRIGEQREQMQETYRNWWNRNKDEINAKRREDYKARIKEVE